MAGNYFTDLLTGYPSFTRIYEGFSIGFQDIGRHISVIDFYDCKSFHSSPTFMLVRIALIVTQMANGRVNHPTNWVNDSAPNLPNKREIGPPPAAIIRNDNTAKPPKTNTNTKDRICLLYTSDAADD